MNSFFLVILILCCCVHCETLVVAETQLHAKNKFMTDILKTFFLNQASVTVFNVDSSLSLPNYKDAMMQLVQSVAPFILYNRLDDELAAKITDMGDELSVPSTTKGYFIMNTCYVDIMHHLPLLSKINANGKWVVVLVNIEQRHVESFFINAWFSHKMANILVLLMNDLSSLVVISYNPFELVDNQYGSFWRSEVNDMSIESVLNNVDMIFERKVRNLQNYPFKAVQFNKNSIQNEIIDGIYLQIMQKILKSKFTFIQPRFEQYHGTRLPNGTFTGNDCLDYVKIIIF